MIYKKSIYPKMIDILKEIWYTIQEKQKKGDVLEKLT